MYIEATIELEFNIEKKLLNISSGKYGGIAFGVIDDQGELVDGLFEELSIDNARKLRDLLNFLIDVKTDHS